MKEDLDHLLATAAAHDQGMSPAPWKEDGPVLPTESASVSFHYGVHGPNDGTSPALIGYEEDAAGIAWTRNHLGELVSASRALSEENGRLRATLVDVRRWCAAHEKGKDCGAIYDHEVGLVALITEALKEKS